MINDLSMIEVAAQRSPEPPLNTPQNSTIHRQSALLSELLLALYVSTDVSDTTTNGFLTRLKQCLNLQHATVIVLRSGKAGPVYNSFDPTEDPEQYGERLRQVMAFYGEDPFHHLPPQRFTRIEDVLPRHDFMERPGYREYLAPHDIYFLAAIDWLAADETARIALRLARSRDQGPFGPDEQAIIELLLPHFQQTGLLAMQMRQLKTESQVYASALPRQSLGIITLDRHGRILHSNSQAVEMLRRGDGIRESGNRITLNCSRLNETFNHTLKLTLTSLQNEQQILSNALAIPRTSGKGDYQMLIKPLPPEEAGGPEFRPYLMVLIKDPDQDTEISIRTLMNLYQLTVSEASVAILMAGGRTIDEVAAEFKVKRNTVRAHLRSMFMKMGVRQQSKMVSLVLSSLASIQ
ncbi:MAG: helix-turn-helix transcriptional regulator [Pseudomonadota bacterium]|nr:helix-turn-helix transcriptional regulator [Pseudomonadota bacterium]